MTQTPVIEFLGYITTICLVCYMWWGWQTFDELGEFDKKLKIPWLILMGIIIVGLVLFYNFM